MTLLLELAQEVHEFSGRREPIEDWKAFRRERVPQLRARVGEHSVTTMGRYPRRFTDAKVWCRIGGQTFEHMWEGEPRSRYIDACNGGKTRSLWHRKDHDGVEAIAGAMIPHYRRAGMPAGPVVCIDLDHAYWAFARHFSTQVEYRPETGDWAAVGEPWRDLPTLMRAKVLRSTICTVSWRNRMGTWYDHGEPKETKSPYYQPQAWRLLSDYLMSVAMEVIAMWPGQVWAVNNDGYVIDEGLGGELAEFLLERWGVASKVEKRWAPGQEWPWLDKHPACAVREVPDKVRQRLAWAMTGDGPMDGVMTALRGRDGELVFTMPPPPLEPPAKPWQAKRGLSRWQLLELELPTRPNWRRPATRPRWGYCIAGPDVELEELEWTEPTRGPPHKKEEEPPGKGSPSRSSRTGSAASPTVPNDWDLPSARRGLAAARAVLGSGLGRS